MWRDELQVWMFAEASPSVAGLIRTSRYSGHPPLWNLCVYLLTRFTDQPLSMQLFHVLTATIVVYVVTRFAPFTPLEKTLFTFGYFPWFEYAVISRGYSLGLLFTFAFCAMFSRSKRPQIALALVLVLLSQTSAHGTILAIAFGLAWAFDTLLAIRTGCISAIPKGRLVCAAVILVVGIASAIASMVPPQDSFFNLHLAVSDAVRWNGFDTIRRVGGAIANYWRSYVPVPQPTLHFWGTNILDDVPPVMAILSLPIALFALLLVVRQPTALFLFVFGSAGLLAFWYFRRAANVNHSGHLFVLLLAAYWLSKSLRQWDVNWLTLPFVAFCDRHRYAFLVAMLSVHVLVGASASGMDLVYPFSASRDAAKFILKHYSRGIVIVGDHEAPASAVAGYLNRQIYYASDHRFGTFMTWRRKEKSVPTEEDVIVQATDLLLQAKSDVLLVLNYKLKRPWQQFELTQSFEKSVVPDETYYLYVGKYHAASPRPR